MSINITVWQTLVGLGVVSLYLATSRDRLTAPMLLTATLTWSYLALRSASISVGYGAGAVVEPYPGLQWLFGFLSLAAFAALLALVFDLWGEDATPSDDASTDTTDDYARTGPRTPLRDTS